MSYVKQVIILHCRPPFASLLHPSKKVLSFPFSLGKKRIYLETQLKGEFTNLFWKFPGCSLFSQAE